MMSHVPKATKDKSSAIKKAKESGRTVIWLAEDRLWRCAVNLKSTPFDCIEFEELSPTKGYTKEDWLKDKDEFGKGKLKTRR